MSDFPEDESPTKPLRKARRTDRTEAPARIRPSPTPTDRLTERTQEPIETLEDDKRRYIAKVESLQDKLDQLLPENARLKQALHNAVSNNITSTILVTVGGGLISFAAFVEGVERGLAFAGLAALLSGITVLIVATCRGRG